MKSPVDSAMPAKDFEEYVEYLAWKRAQAEIHILLDKGYTPPKVEKSPWNVKQLIHN